MEKEWLGLACVCVALTYAGFERWLDRKYPRKISLRIGDCRYSASDPNDMEARLYRNLLDDDLTKAVESLPEDFRTVVILCDIEGFTYEEIAEFVDCPIGTVRSRLHRGRKLLRNKLIEYARVRGYNVDEERHRKSGMWDDENGTLIGKESGMPIENGHHTNGHKH